MPPHLRSQADLRTHSFFGGALTPCGSVGTLVPMKRCACGVGHTAASWRALRFVGIWDLGDGERAEMRNCTCGSTLCLELPSEGLLSDLTRVFCAEAAGAEIESERAYLSSVAKALCEQATALQTCATRAA